MYSKFETEIVVRPDDIDMNQHVHNAKYLDYVLFARYDQMGRCYGMSIDEFLRLGYNWVVKAVNVEFKRSLTLGEHIIVRTWVEEILKTEVQVGFEILKKENGKLSAGGTFRYTMVDGSTGKAEEIPQWIVEKYSV